MAFVALIYPDSIFIVVLDIVDYRYGTQLLGCGYPPSFLPLILLLLI
jgi:hypothetical protein